MTSMGHAYLQKNSNSMVTAGCALCPFLKDSRGHKVLHWLVLFLSRRHKLQFGALPKTAGMRLVMRIGKNRFRQKRSAQVKVRCALVMQRLLVTIEIARDGISRLLKLLRIVTAYALLKTVNQLLRITTEFGQNPLPARMRFGLTAVQRQHTFKAVESGFQISLRLVAPSLSQAVPYFGRIFGLL